MVIKVNLVLLPDLSIKGKSYLTFNLIQNITSNLIQVTRKCSLVTV